MIGARDIERFFRDDLLESEPNSVFLRGAYQSVSSTVS
jgi:hypothetical protein